MKTGLGVLLILKIFSTPAFSNTTFQQKLEAEEILRARIDRVLETFDSMAEVVVEIQYRDSRLRLPLVGYEIHTSQEKAFFSSQDISRIKVRIISSLSEFPPDLKRLVQIQIPIDQRRISISVEKWREPVLALVRKDEIPLESKIDVLVENFRSGMASYKPFLIRGFFAISAFLFISVVLFGSILAYLNSLKSLLRDGFHNLAKSFESTLASKKATHYLAEEPHPAPPTIQPQKSTNQHDNYQLHSMKINSAFALLSDCYWCEKDVYGAWLWENFSFDQKEELVRLSSRWFQDYILYLSKLPINKNMNFHQDPYYLQPLEISEISQADLQDQINKNPGLYRRISNLRRQSLKMSLRERIDHSRHEGQQVFALSQSKSLPRQLQYLDRFELSSNDELEVLANPDLLDPELRPLCPTLIWAHFVPKEELVSFLEDMSASELANLWVAPEPTLDLISSCLTEKKSRLVSDYVSDRGQGDKNSTEYLNLFNKLVNSKNLAIPFQALRAISAA